MSNAPKEIFEKGMLVRLKDDLPIAMRKRWEEVLDHDTIRRILAVENHPEYGEIAYVGPKNISEKNIEDFRPDEDHASDPRYYGVVSIVTENLTRLLN